MESKRRSKLSETWRLFRKNKTAVLGLTVIMLIILSAVFADLIVPYTKVVKQDYRSILQPPSAQHWMGTDGYGRDIFARIIHGGRNSLALGFVTSLSALVIGGSIGAAAGYYGGWFEDVVMRGMDALKAIPNTLMALAIVAALGPSMLNLLIAIGVSSTPIFVRVVRSAVISISGMEYIEAAKAGGTGDARIIFKHVVPNAIGVIIVQSTMSIAQMILQAASLSFIGMGIQPPSPEWGAMLSEAREYMRTAPYFMLFPGLAIALSALSLNLLGDGLRDALDPRLKS
jgi:peptide/nickel transport system permease protein